jgi:hypothetical protein
MENTEDKQLQETRDIYNNAKFFVDIHNSYKSLLNLFTHMETDYLRQCNRLNYTELQVKTKAFYHTTQIFNEAKLKLLKLKMFTQHKE